MDGIGCYPSMGLTIKSDIKEKMSEERIELSTNGLKGHCSAIELLARNEKILPPALPSVNILTGLLLPL